jgi:uncharacterized protein (DUF2236 family)
MAPKLPGLRQIVKDTERLIARSVSTASPEDPGFFGPGSVAWRVHQHTSHGIGGVCSLLVEALHPVAMAAVDQHSTYRDDPWLRANRTSEYVYTIIFGSRETAEAAAANVRAIHKHVRGVDPVTGRAYRADDGDLLMWIHCAGVYSTLLAYETYAKSLGAEADRYVDEMRVSGELVGLDRADAPSSRDELESYMRDVRPELQLTKPAAEVLHTFLHVGMPVTVRPFWGLHIVGALAILPDWAREMYDIPTRLPKGPATKAAIGLSLSSMYVGMGALPGIREARNHLRSIREAAPQGTSH